MSGNHQLAKSIRILRLARGYTQDVFCEKIHMCQSSYASLESGKSAITFDRMLDIAYALDIDIHDLIDVALGVNRNILHSTSITHPPKRDDHT